MRTITLKQEEQEVIKEICVKRLSRNAVIGNPNKVEAASKEYFYLLNGYGGELGFCILANVFPDLTWLSPGIWDCIVNGKTVDVKTTNASTPSLIVDNPKREIDYYVLMVGSFPSYEYLGFCSREELSQNYVEVNGKEKYIVTSDKLNKEKLWLI